jgi:8-oxo-dGTP pyrophosphatase MutT (NUDIX family)
MPSPIEKVTAFVTRQTGAGHDLLLFRAPHAGIHIPAGTVEDGESHEEAAIREAHEETGLTGLTVRAYLGCQEDALPESQRVVLKPTTVYARPDTTSFDWAHFRKGIVVTVERQTEGFTQATYREFDRIPDPQYITYHITGWVPTDTLTDTRQRYFYHLTFEGETPARWTVYADHHHFELFWAPLNDLPAIIPPQDEWLKFLKL